MSETTVQYLVLKPETKPSSLYVDKRFPDGSLAFRYDPQRRIIEIQTRGKKHYFDLEENPPQTIDNSEQIR